MGHLKVTIILQILLGVFTSIISEHPVEIDTETEISSENNEMGPNEIDSPLHYYSKNKREVESLPSNDSIKAPKRINRAMATNHPFQTDAAPLYSFVNSPEQIRNHLSFVTEGYFPQLVDHNNPSLGTFFQKYFLFSEWCENHLEYGIHYQYPQVFAIFGTESTSFPTDFFFYGFFMDDARKYKACCVILEHRQYGNSTIGKDASVKNLEFLRTDQTLDDMARFVLYFNYEYNIKYKKWAFYGCSLAGSYVSRFAVRHPEHYEFGIAAAACRQTFYNFHQFMDTVSEVLGEINPECRNIVTKAFDIVTKLVEQARKGTCENLPPTDCAQRNTDILEIYLQFCGNFDIFKEVDSQVMALGAFYYLAVLTQYNLIANNAIGYTVQDFCGYITTLPSDNNNPYDNLRKFFEANCLLVKNLVGIPLDFPCEFLCINFIDHAGDVEFCREINWDAEANAQGFRQWEWQICQYFENFITTSGPKSAFGKLLTTFHQQKICIDCFEHRFNSVLNQLTVSENNKLYGGLKGIPGSCPSCTLFITHGRDPWKGCGLLHPHDINCGGYDNKFVHYSNGSHCSTAYPDNFDDPNDGYLKEAKREIHGAIDHWMTEGCGYPPPVQCPR